MKRKCICILCGMLLLLVVSGCSLASPSPSSSPSSSSDFTTVLSKLGITVDSASNRIDSNGNAVDATVNPFGYKNTVVHKNCEIFISGIKYKNNYTSFLENKSYSVKGSDSDGAWANSYYNKSTAADIDGDGIDEVITIYYDSSKSSKKEIVFRELNYSSSTVKGKNLVKFDISSLNLPDPETLVYQMSIASGDIDGDGKDEIVAFYMNEMFILDGGSSLYKIKQAVSIAEDESDSFFRAKCADFNGDGKDEIILVEGAHEDKKVAECTIYDWDGAELLSPMTSFSNYRFSIEASGTNNGIRTPDFATGDFNGDGTPDIAFAGQSSDKDTIHLLVVCKVAVNDDSKPEFTCLADNGSNVVGNTKNWFSSVACGDLDMNTDSNGHFRNEIVDYDDVYKVSEDSKGAASVEKKYSDKLNTPYPDMLAVGDVNNDGVAEIVTEYQNIDELHIYHLDSDSSFSCKKLDTSDTEKDGSICLPDIEGKSEVLEYVAHTLQYSTPQVLAVITAPPCYSSDSAANQNLNDTSLEFGKTTTTEITSENSVGLSVGISFGSSIETPLWGSAGSSEIKTTVTNSFTAAFSDSTENTYSKGFQSSPGDTKVVFTSIPYDVYEYLVIQSADTSKTPVGTYTTINVPRAPEMVSQSIDYYNENNGDGVDVDTSIEVSATRTVKPKAGEPASYPTYADCKAVAAAFSHSPVNALFSSKDASFDITVGQGSSSETLSIQSSATSSASYSYNLSVSTEMENVADGVLVGASFEMTSGYSYTTSVGKGVYVNLQLGQLDCDNTIYPDYKYTTGLMMFPVSKTYTVDDTAQTAEYTMVTCWVEQ